ncbi:hypothetical protein B9Z55_011938 [Caenorhabditis nigoni]|uniref:Uncharacterized protein n=1 Tax=Caenorhabditis nigoni TaxID=1611254 RepID=A0A2G5UMV0_9PELO|nr:hypothetical protein B9Z55_011938 [Caenorhabditis nigoni]
MRFFNMLRTVNMLPAVSKKITAPSSSNFLRTNIRELTTQSKHVYATQEVIIGAQKKKIGTFAIKRIYIMHETFTKSPSMSSQISLRAS